MHDCYCCSHLPSPFAPPFLFFFYSLLLSFILLTSFIWGCSLLNHDILITFGSLMWYFHLSLLHWASPSSLSWRSSGDTGDATTASAASAASVVAVFVVAVAAGALLLRSFPSYGGWGGRTTSLPSQSLLCALHSLYILSTSSPFASSKSFSFIDLRAILLTSPAGHDKWTLMACEELALNGVFWLEPLMYGLYCKRPSFWKQYLWKL